MKKAVLSVLVAGLMVTSANAAILTVNNAADLSGKLTLGPNESGDIGIYLTMGATDTIEPYFVNAFLDASGDNVDVTGVAGGQAGWVYDRSSFTLPAEISQDGGNEYGLISGCQEGDPCTGLPLGTGMHLIDTLTVTNDGTTSGSVDVTFETGPRAPQAFGSGPAGFPPFTLAPPAFPPGFANFLYLGDDGSNNTPFEINFIPEPATFALLAFGGLAMIRRRR